MTDRELLEVILSKVEGMETRMDGMEDHMQRMETRMDGMEDHMQRMETRMDGMEDHMQRMETRMDGMETRMQGLEEKVAGIDLHLENVTDWNIRLLAENHLSLVKKLDEAVSTADKTALYEIQVRILTEKVDKLTKEVAGLKVMTA